MEGGKGIAARLDASELCYAADGNNSKSKRILRDVTFSVGSGTFAALMGPSGAGKSTLLDLLAARKLDGIWSGTIQIDGQPRSKYFSRETAYVLQDRILLSTLTTEETIRYAARTLLPEGTSRMEIQQRVELVMEMLKLTHIRDSRVGDAMTKGISGGQAKRLSIAVEIVHLPRLIFLDEPTSGLDSSIAFEVMSTVRGIVGKSVTCVCTIHQPSKEIFALFDHLLLLSSGRLIYSGPAAEAVRYFTGPQLGFSFADGSRNPAEFVLEVSCGQRLATGWLIARQPQELAALFKASVYFQPVTLQSESAAKAADSSDSWSLHGSDRYVTSQWTQLAMLMERSWVVRFRDTAELRAQLIKNAVITLLIGLVYWQAGTISTPFYEDGSITSDANSVNSFLFFFSITAITANVHMIPFVLSRAPLYHRELASNTYAPLPYWLSTFLTSLPTQLVFHLLSCTVVYPMVGLNSNARVFCYFLFVTYLCNVITTAVCMAIAAGTGSEMLSIGLFNVAFLFLSMLSCYNIRYEDIPSYWKWATYVSYPKWIFEGLMVNEWNQYDTDDSPGDDATGSGDILSDYSFDAFNAADTIWISLLFVAAFLGLSYYFLQAPPNRLRKAADAAELISVLSQTGQSGATRNPDKLKHALPEERRATKNAAADLKAGLLNSSESSMESIDEAEEPPLVHQPKLSVDSFRASTGAVDQSPGCHLVFRDVQYSLPAKNAKEPGVTLLKGMTGHARPKEMVALMGASGAGKSTLLDVLAQRKSTGTVSGDITYNGAADLVPSAYVMQDDIHIGSLTVRESIYFAAELRLSQGVSATVKAKRVEKIIDMLGLRAVADSILGSQTVRGVSGGELKRVSIAVEIVHLPGLMFLDEPTTGLDSSIALEVMSAVRNLANQNRTVICTIHQPSEDIFSLFDALMLLAEGRVVYFGAASAAVEYFTQAPFGFSCNPDANPADFVVAIAGAFLPAKDGRLVTGGELHAHYATSEQARNAVPSAASLSGSIASATAQSDTPEISPPTTFWHQVKTLMHRRWLSMSREPGPLLAPLIVDVFNGFLLGSLYYQIDSGEGCDAGCYTDRMSLLYYSVLLLVMGRMSLVAGLFHDRLVFYRERGSKAYGSLPYCLSVLLPRMPITMLNVLCYSLFLYPMTGLRGGSHFCVFFVVLLLVGYCGLFLAFAIISVSSSASVALSYFPAIINFSMFYAGYVVYIPAMAEWQKDWLPYMSMLRYAFQGLVLNEFQDNNDLPEAQDYIHQLGFNVISIQGCCGILLLWIAGMMVVFCLAVTYINFEER